VHPTEQVFATCGADKTIRLWKENQMLQASAPTLFQHDLTAIDWASNGQFLVVGDRNCSIFTVDPKTLTILATAKGGFADKPTQHREPWVEDLKVSPCCTMVAFGSHGGVSPVEVYKVLDGGRKLQKVGPVNVGSTSAITQLDWSLDSQSLMVNTQAPELKFASIA
jgi:WD40 repeat protein